ncbi:PTS system D-mannitol-specific IIA component (Fru family) /PTS system D-mannitol-specific IIB component (Fru family) /PTS system D-mannitol-specific IIC component (Fru family) [Hypnocyclicus thermotrophus]|uniref:PTS system mannitol-specific EIICBA component n=1 Tax=Hypnocyclicus thermotrophus TaxID=1627895 RepID=A0AA46DWW6_9FUSO|nr:PTS mannitol transporter subunit IICBA [Hypnocyclicus thermotrophus]TDT66992.1 PTS system D-mannitol-specific IIA component (Fru family) /PTS system D-mannitol-specific IIB component (Fru family) /PTS system D-mannitol-specific IIC component (Fru family) [Hypnocyclicus thermotrophus]
MSQSNLSENLGEQNLKVKVQAFGRFLSSMVMPNIGAFIAWGLITALFIPVGWMPNATLSKLVGPMITYLLPLLIGYTGGKVIGGERGAVVGAIATSGVIIGTNIPMFMGAMIAGPVGGYCIKKFDEAIQGKIKAGFEMLVNNFSSGIIGMILALFFFKVMGPAVEVASTGLGNAVQVLVKMNLLPLTSILVEPAKILFLNNAINHGVFTPLGVQQSTEIGKSLFFFIEANPGPGLGILLAYWFFGKGSAKESAPGAIIIHFLGGIHEIYFPYVLMNPLLIIAAILGGMSGVFTNVILKGGLIAPAAPGSIFAALAMTPKDGFLATISAVVVAAAVSFFVGIIILNKEGQAEEDLEAAEVKMKAMKNKPSTSANNSLDAVTGVSRIVVACDAGMGSSAMGASLLRKKVKNAGLNIDVTNLAINNLTEDIDIVITHKDLTPRAKTVVKSPIHMSISNFMDGDFYDNLVEELKKKQINKGTVKIETKANDRDEAKSDILVKEGITLGLPSISKIEAIKEIGIKMANMGYVAKDYYKYMLEREEKSSVYIGNGVAIPHGTLEGKAEVLKTGIVINQYPEGIDFDGEKAYLLIGIAGKNNEHIDIISNIADIIEDEDKVVELGKTKNIDDIYNSFII